MQPVVLWTVVAFAVGGAVLLVAALVAVRSGGVRRFLADLRGGVRRGVRTGPVGIVAQTHRDMTDAADADAASVSEIFEIGEPQEVGYLGTGHLGGGSLSGADPHAENRPRR